ncbi:MAG: hypothetical protein LUQ11_09265 [Methylococcaceae bacterium]|nr:hypothetical protein [Methylococcaceae bacterium]
MLKSLGSRLNNIANFFNGLLTSRMPLKTRSFFSRPAWTDAPVVKKLLKTLGYTLLACIILLTVLLSFALDDTPQPIVLQGLNRDDIQRAKLLLHVSPEDRESIKTVSLNQKDLNIAAGYLLSHFVENTTLIQIVNDRILFQIAVFVPQNPWGRYLDFSFSLNQVEDAIRIKSFKIGEISIPDPTANRLIPFIIRHTPLNKYWVAANQYVKNVRITPQTLDISYLGSIVDTAKQLAINKHKNYPNLHVYQQQINDIVSRHDPAWRLSLSDLLQPLFLSAFQRSDDDDAIRENRAVIIAVASYIYKNELRRYLPLGLVYSKEYPVFAYKRIDIPQHFIASALVTAVDSSLLSEQLSVDKEVGDAQQGSGFSFIDLTADRAGTRFGRLAIASPHQARELQRMMSTLKHYSSIIPDIQDLPEHMDEQAFKLKYGGIDSPAYQAMIREIDTRISALPMYRNQ